MIAFARVAIDAVETYESERDGRIAVPNTSSYVELKRSIERQGVLDPLIIMVTPKRPCLVETGASRIAAATELGIETLPAIVYNRNKIQPGFPTERQLANVEEIEALFGTKEVTAIRDDPAATDQPPAKNPEDASTGGIFAVVISGPRDPLTGEPTTLDELSRKYIVQDAPGLRQIKAYIASGIARF